MTGRSYAVGQRLPDLVRTLDLADLVAYGAATWDWHRLHYDPEMAAAAGFDRPVVDGQMLGALLAEQATLFGRSGCRLTRLHFRNLAPVLCGSTIVCRGEVTHVGPAGMRIDHDVVIDGDDLAGQRRLVATGGAELIFEEHVAAP